ncbi:rhodanese-like domain-containing protein [candidate division KSB1 bacterium]|nr:rhodanese-like domain-containing protein [candidate division KSB1 bacterium]
MGKYWINAKIMRESLVLVVLAVIVAAAFQLFRPNSELLSFDRPQITFAADSLLTAPLPAISIDDSSAFGQAVAIGEPIVITIEQMQYLLETDAAIALDARSPQEFAAGHLPGARNLPLEELYEHEETIQKWSKNKWLATYCDGPPCDQGEVLAWELTGRGFDRVAIFAPGTMGWQAAGLPLQKGERVHE